MNSLFLTRNYYYKDTAYKCTVFMLIWHLLMLNQCKMKYLLTGNACLLCNTCKVIFITISISNTTMIVMQQYRQRLNGLWTRIFGRRRCLSGRPRLAAGEKSLFRGLISVDKTYTYSNLTILLRQFYVIRRCNRLKTTVLLHWTSDVCLL